MSSTNHTSNYNLSQFVGSDKPAWLVEYNSDMTKIDTAIKANADSIATKIETVTTASIENGAVTAPKIADDAVTTNKILNSNVTNSKIADNAVTSGKIADGAVTSGKIGAGAVTAEKMDGSTFALPANNGWEGFIDTQGRKHRYIIKEGSVASVPAYQSKSVGVFNPPDDMGEYGVDYEIVSICEHTDYGESNISFPIFADGSTDFYFAVYNGYQQARATIKYKVYIEVAEL